MLEVAVLTNVLTGGGGFGGREGGYGIFYTSHLKGTVQGNFDLSFFHDSSSPIIPLVPHFSGSRKNICNSFPKSALIAVTTTPDVTDTKGHQ
jgi:hypothetical protein